MRLDLIIICTLQRYMLSVIRGIQNGMLSKRVLAEQEWTKGGSQRNINRVTATDRDVTCHARDTHLAWRAESVRDPLRGVRAARAALTHLLTLPCPPLRARGGRGRAARCAHHTLNVLADSPEPPNVSWRGEKYLSWVHFRSGTNLISEWRWWRKGIRWVTLTCSLEINQLASAPWKFGHDQYRARFIAYTDLSLEHGGRRGASLVLQPEGHRRGDAVLEITDLDQEDKSLGEKYFGLWLTERKAWMRSALILARGFPFTTTVYVSSFSVDIRLPNQDLFVSSGEDSGVWCTLTTSRKWRNSIKILFVSFHAKVTASRTEPSEIEDGGGKLSSTPLTISNQSLPDDQQLPCIFLRWNLGLPRKLFLIELSRDLQWTAEGEPGGVGSSCSVSPPGSKISNIQIRGKFEFNQNTPFLGINYFWLRQELKKCKYPFVRWKLRSLFGLSLRPLF